MRSKTLTTLCTYGLLGSAAAVTFTLPGTLAPPTMMASTPPDTLTITSIVRASDANIRTSTWHPSPASATTPGMSERLSAPPRGLCCSSAWTSSGWPAVG
ncbi:MAG: hypothetical protein GY715_21860 [Planctomycetes bacterium]|nr:hypothetical protein [Planctomycetota bacterium]